MRKVGLLGGSFNPPHLGHVGIAHKAVNKLDLDSLLLAPTKRNPLKSDDYRYARADHRVAMLEECIDYFPDEAEIELADVQSIPPNYTYNLVKHILDRNDHYIRLFLVLGEDVAAGFDKWHKPGVIKDLCEAIAVFHRAGVDSDPEEVLSSLADRNTNLIYYSKDKDSDPISSTMIREENDIREVSGVLLPREVADYIEENELYR